MKALLDEIYLGPTPDEMDRLQYQEREKRHHVIPDTELIRACRAVTGLDNLFVYHHLETDKFVLAQWVVSPSQSDRPCFNEIENMDLPPDRGGWIPLRMIELRCKPQYVLSREVEANILANQSAEKSRKADALTERESTEKWLCNKGKPEVAEAVRRAPYSPGEGSKNIAESLNEAAKNRIITHA